MKKDKIELASSGAEEVMNEFMDRLLDGEYKDESQEKPGSNFKSGELGNCDVSSIPDTIVSKNEFHLTKQTIQKGCGDVLNKDVDSVMSIESKTDDINQDLKLGDRE